MISSTRSLLLNLSSNSPSALDVHPLISSILSPSPPPSIFIHAPSNPTLAIDLISSHLAFSHQSIHPLLPNFISLDLSQIINSKNLFDSILNHFALWNPPWSSPGLQSWNAQLLGLHATADDPSSLKWDYDSIIPLNRSGLLAQPYSTSFDGFCHALRIISHQLSYTDLSTHAVFKLDQPFPRFIIINHPERLRFWNDLNLISSLTRLPELAGCAVHTIFVSQLPWSKLRPRYGALDPVTFVFPKLSDADLAKLLTARGPPPPVEKGRDLISSFTPFVTFIVATFASQTSSDLFELASLVDRIWPDWLLQMDEAGLTGKDTARMILLSRSTIEREQQNYGSPVWHIPPFMTKPTGLEGPDPTADDAPGATAPSSPSHPRLAISPSKTRVSQQIATPFTTPSKPRHYLSVFSPHTPSSQIHHPFATPSKAHARSGPAPFARQKPQDSLSASLPVVARFILIASYIASFNPPRTDLGLFLTTHQVSSKKRGNRAARKPQPGQEVKAKVGQHLLGPKSVPINRVLAIFGALVDQEGHEFDEIDVLQQVGQLIQSRLLIPMNANTYLENNLDNFKVGCGLDRIGIEWISKSTGVDLQSRIWDG